MGWLSGWDNRVKITIDNTNVDGVLSNFPICLNISASSGIGSTDLTAIFDKLTQDANRKKIAVTTSDGETQCYVEIERWDDANEKAVLWVKAPSVASGAETILYLYYDSSQADNTTYVGDTGDTPAQSVWDANFKAVYHMAQDPNGDVADAIKDSTSNAIHGTPVGAMTSADLVDGKIGKAIDFDESNDYLKTAAADDVLNITTTLTLEAIIKPSYTLDSGLVGDVGIISRQHLPTAGRDTYAFVINPSGKLHLGSYGGSIQSTKVSWALNTTFYIAGTYNSIGLIGDLFVDNVKETLTTNNYDSMAGGTNSLAIAASTAAYLFPGIIDEVRISNVVRSDAWIKATYYSNWDGLVTFEFEEEEVFHNLNTEIAADFLTSFADLLSDIAAVGESITDLETEIKAGSELLTDLNVDTEAKAQVLTDLLSDIRARDYTFYDLNTAIEAVRSKWWLKTEIKAGCAARWNFNTEWNPNRFLNTAIEAKKPHEFSFKTQSAEGYAATIPSVEFKVPGYSFPLRTLFLDYISVGSSNEYQLELWWARGLIGKGTLKNAKIKAEYIDTSNAGGHEVVTLNWISIKVGDGEYQTVNETALLLDDILCDSKLDVTLKVECRDCSVSRGLIFFKLIITGDWKESIFGGPTVYRDGKLYHSGLQDDYKSIDFICRLYVVV